MTFFHLPSLLLLAASSSIATGSGETNQREDYDWWTSNLRGWHAVDDSPHAALPEEGLSVTRTINQVPDGSNFHLELDGDHCAQQDGFGVNDCHYDWGEVIEGTYSLNVTQHIDHGDIIRGAFKIDLVVPWEFSCQLCGEDCVLRIPVIEVDHIIRMPPCPVEPHFVKHTIQYALRSHSPTDGIPTHVEGIIHLQKQNGDALASFQIDANIK